MLIECDTAIYAWSCVLLDCSLAVGLSPGERNEMQLHVSVGVNR